MKESNKGDYFVGESVSIADIFVFDIMEAVHSLVDDAYDNYENIKKFMKHFESLKEYKNFAESDRRNPKV